MCFAFDARPPDLPAECSRRSPAARARSCSSSSRRTARASPPRWPSRPSRSGRAVVILPDVRGLYPFYSELAERFASAGHHAIAIDYFGRTAGLGPRGEDFEFWPHVAADAAGDRAGRHRRGDCRAARADRRRAREHGRVLLRRHAVVPGGDERGARARGRGRLLRRAQPRALGRECRRSTARARCSGPVLGLYGGADAGHPARAGRGVRARPRRARGVSTRSSPTRARRTRSSTAASRSTPTPARTPGGASWRSSSRPAPRSPRRGRR